jgi:hypothetical protein
VIGAAVVVPVRASLRVGVRADAKVGLTRTFRNAVAVVVGAAAVLVCLVARLSWAPVRAARALWNPVPVVVRAAVVPRGVVAGYPGALVPAT